MLCSANHAFRYHCLPLQIREITQYSHHYCIFWSKIYLIHYSVQLWATWNTHTNAQTRDLSISCRDVTEKGLFQAELLTPLFSALLKGTSVVPRKRTGTFPATSPHFILWSMLDLSRPHSAWHKLLEFCDRDKYWSTSSSIGWTDQ